MRAESLMRVLSNTQIEALSIFDCMADRYGVA